MRVAKAVLLILETYSVPAPRRVVLESKAAANCHLTVCMDAMEKQGLLERSAATSVYGDVLKDPVYSLTALGHSVLQRMSGVGAGC